ncbi:MAG: hypothetical protein NTY48_05110 [Candidatus Diapherotrites archaeon]|nr:hypothetical protein [Candidatus Diapherotrites archaeon]
MGRIIDDYCFVHFDWLVWTPNSKGIRLLRGKLFTKEQAKAFVKEGNSKDSD